MKRTSIIPCCLIAAAIAFAAGCSSTPGETADASADVAVPETGADTGGPVAPEAGADAPGNVADAADAAAPSDAANQDGAVAPTLSTQRVADVRACMDARWGTADTRSALDVADDFDACTTPAENTGPVGDANFALVLDGWAEPDPADHSLFRKVGPHDH